MLSRDGEASFSVRKLGADIGVDPMTILHHFGSKDELLRRIANSNESGDYSHTAIAVQTREQAVRLQALVA